MQYRPYAEQLYKTVNMKECKGCKSLHFADTGKILIPFCFRKWFEKDCKKEVEA